MIWVIALLAMSAFAFVLMWSLCVIAKRSDEAMGADELAAYWPSMPDLEGTDIFADKYGPPTGTDNA